jgi:c-di-GMP-binding flagellar brake protein YcgR
MIDENVLSTPLSPIPRRGAPRLSDALAPIAAGAEPHTMDDPFDIGEALATLAESGEAVTIYPDGAVAPRMARIDAVDPELPHFVLDLAAGAAIPSGAATFVSSLGGNAQIQFQLTQAWTSLPDKPNLVPAVFPSECLVLNRRAQQRRESPLGPHYVASFAIRGETHQWPLCDFSLGGVGLRATPEEAKGFVVGRKLQGVRLQLGPALMVTADLEIRLMRPFRSFLLGEQVQIGCRFTNISMQVQQSIRSLVREADKQHRT